jgi:hypothetical protein
MPPIEKRVSLNGGALTPGNGFFPSLKFGYVTTLSDVPYQFSTENTLEHSKHRSEAIGKKIIFRSKSRIGKSDFSNGGAVTPCNAFF